MTASLPSTFKHRPESPTWNPTAKLPLDLCAKPLENGQAKLANACPYSLARCSRSWTADALNGRNDRSAVSYTFARQCATLHDPIYSSVAEIHIPVMRRIRPTPLMLRCPHMIHFHRLPVLFYNSRMSICLLSATFLSARSPSHS